jgi:uncharacterized delta-60 repeat protein
LEDRALPTSFGSLDATFGQGGLLTTSIGAGSAEVRALVLQSDGKLVAGGYSYDSHGNEDFTLARYTSSGTLDSSFGTGGIVQTTPPRGVNSTQIFGLALQSDGKIVAVGQALVSSKKTTVTETEVTRYNANGTLDTTFGTTGIVFAQLSSDSVGVQSDGKIVVVGSQQGQAELIRYNSNGSLDTTFGSGGSVLNASVAGAGHLVIQSDGKLLVAAGNPGVSLARFLPSGQLDASFGTNGITSGNVPPGFTSGIGTTNVVLKGDGTMFGIGRSGYATLTIAHFSSGGQLDTTFGNAGWVVNSNLAFAGPAAFASNGDLLLAGSSSQLYGADFAVEAFLPSGALDTTFGTNGLVTTDFGADDGGRAIVVQSDGRIVVGGFTNATPSTYYGFALARYLGSSTTAPVAAARLAGSSGTAGTSLDPALAPFLADGGYSDPTAGTAPTPAASGVLLQSASPNPPTAAAPPATALDWLFAHVAQEAPVGDPESIWVPQTLV